MDINALPAPELTVLTLVLVVEWLLPAPYSFSLARGFRILADAFANKVAKPGSVQQQKLAGWLALATYLFIILSILLSVLFAVKNDIWTQGLLLYLSLGYQGFANQAKHLQSLIQRQQKLPAKTILAEFSEYDVSKLSILGLNKLTLELTVIRFVSFWLVPILLFLLFNGVTALVYRAIIEAYFCWLPQKEQFQHFGQSTRVIKNLVELLPSLIIAPIYSIFKSSPGWSNIMQQSKSQWRATKTSSNNLLIWLSIVAAGCKSELAGPLMLTGKKLVRPRLNQGAPLTDVAISDLLSWNNRFRATVVLFNLLVIAIFTLLPKQ